MVRKLTLSLTAATAACGLILTGAAGAFTASSPSVSSVSTKSIKDSSALLVGRVNPNGSQTSFYFAFGPSTAYGRVTPPHSVGRGVKSKGVGAVAGGLLPGTVYHFHLIAGNSRGQTIGSDHTFRTAGNPPAIAETGAATNVGRNSATLTGTVLPNNQATAYAFQYGPTIAYGATTTPPGTVPKGKAPVSVSAPVGALQSGLTFHFRLVAYHGSLPSYGADQTFLTEPFPRYATDVSARTSPKRIRRAPFRLTTSGQIRPTRSVPAADACAGSVRIQLFKGRKRVSRTVAAVQPNCGFSSGFDLRRLPGRGGGRRTVRLKVLVFFTGNGYLAPRGARPEHVTLGRR